MNLDNRLNEAERYIASQGLRLVPGWHNSQQFTLQPLAQGEYNMNCLLAQSGNRWVFRINIGTQINRDDQILYEFRALRLIERSGVTPKPYFVDDSREHFDYGVLVMEFLEGGAMEYETDYPKAAQLFARLHSLEIDPAQNHLIVESRPLSMTYQECSQLLPVYLESELGDPHLRDYLRDVLQWSKEACQRERYFVDDPWRCVINTEVNSGNFISDRERDRLFLVDWEKPLWGDPSQDLSHFCAPMTTLWKTDFRMSAAQKKHFLETYKQEIDNKHLRGTVAERVLLRDPFNHLRGISWSAMAWVKYQNGEHALRNEDTFRKVSSYLDLGFLRELFDPFLRQAP